MPPTKLAANGLPRPAALLALYFEGPIGVDSLKFPWKCRNHGLIGNHGTLKAAQAPPLRPDGCSVSARIRLPWINHPICAYIGQSACQAASECKSGAFA